MDNFCSDFLTRFAVIKPIPTVEAIEVVNFIVEVNNFVEHRVHTETRCSQKNDKGSRTFVLIKYSERNLSVVPDCAATDDYLPLTDQWVDRKIYTDVSRYSLHVRRCRTKKLEQYFTLCDLLL
ncbi:integrase catalytic domain-containing protein [Nephila pilipes]|uniref:Integrase catalytic domain-containing protein n=1 Tax=Nephila pilipes TaxID=299642 RepID=A0A8X6TVB9_NEPPI|nr:integrase catalytic domain-containing protein [Nephila pilipes]